MQARGFAAGERLGGLEGVVAGEQHLAEQTAQFLLRGLRIELVQPLDGGHAVGDGIGVILREIADGDFVAPHRRCRYRRGNSRSGSSM